MKKWQFYCLAVLAFIILTLDGILKRTAVAPLVNDHLALGIPIPFPPFALLLVLFICYSLFIGQFGLAYARKNWLSVAAWFWLSFGTFGNLLDRWRVGGVIDYIPFLNWTKFNLSDVLIVVGMALLVISWNTKHGARSMEHI